MATLNDLQVFIEYDIHPENLTDEQHICEIAQQWEILWKSQQKIIYRLNISLAENADIKTLGSLQLLIQLNNRVQAYLNRHTRLWRNYPSGASVKKLYIQVGNQLAGLINKLITSNPTTFSNVEFTYQERGNITQQLNTQYRWLEDYVNKSEINPFLREIVLKAIYQAIRNRRLTRRTSAYLADLMNTLLHTTGLTTIVFKDKLYQCDFNVPAFFIYWIHDWDSLLADEPGLHEQLELLILEQERLQQLDFRKNDSFLATEDSLKNELNGFLKEKKQSLKELIKLRRTKFKDDQLARMITRIRTTLPVAQLGLFIRLQIEKGILAKEHVGRIFGFYATHFYNAQTEHISADSLQKKSSDVEYATAQKLKALLIGMINWLNEYFKLES